MTRVPDDTNRCDLACAHCYAPKSRGELRFDTITRWPTNSSLRERVGIEEKNAATASRLIRDTLDEGVIVLEDKAAAVIIKNYTIAGIASLLGI